MCNVKPGKAVYMERCLPDNPRKRGSTLQHGARPDTSHHVWGVSEFGMGKVRGNTTKASRNHCAGVW